MLDRFTMLDGLRGVAALVVVFGHLCSGLPLDLGFRRALFTGPIGFLFNGAAAVHVFFILSGFVLTHSLMREGGFGFGSVPGFLVRRIVRLQLPYLAGVAFAWLASSFYTVPHPFGAGPFMASPSVVSVSISNLLNLVWMLPNRAYGLMPVGWTLRVEMIFSLMMPALVAGLTTHVLLFAGLVLGLLSMPLQLVWPFYICNFGVGILMRRHYLYLSKAMERRQMLAWCAMPLGLLLVQLPAIFGWPEPNVLSYRKLIVMMSGSTMVVFACTHAKWWAEKFSHRLPAFLGKISYSLYLVHIPVVLILAGRLGYGVSKLQIVGTSLACLTVSLLIATAMERWVEFPSQQLGRRLGSRLDAALTSSVQRG